MMNLISEGYQSGSIRKSGPAGPVGPGFPSSGQGGQGGQGDPVGQSGQVVQLVMASLDDMHSENIWFTWSKPSDY